eukprot:s4804_g2.t1
MLGGSFPTTREEVSEIGRTHDFPGAVGLDWEIEWHRKIWSGEVAGGLQSYSLPLQGAADSFLGAKIKIWQDMVNFAET